MTTSRALLRVVLVCLLPAAAPARAADPAPEAGRFEAPPPGASKEDQALWWKAKEINVDLPVERSVSTRLQAEVNGSGWQQRLADGVRSGALTEKRAGELQQKLLDEWRELALILSVQWPVDPTRVCGYPWLDLDNLMLQEDSPFKRDQLPQARGKLRDCVEKATQVHATLARANAEYHKAFEAIDRAAPPLAAAAQAKAPAAAPAAAPAR